MKQPEREAFLDGYRHGLGCGIRAIQTIIDTLDTLDTLQALNDDNRVVVRSVLMGLNTGLRQISASVVLADHEPANDE